eukprot:7349970-Lingulodinium_polyedra.AAC.1
MARGRAGRPARAPRHGCQAPRQPGPGPCRYRGRGARVGSRTQPSHSRTLVQDLPKPFSHAMGPG